MKNMTVKELIEELQKQNPNAKVSILSISSNDEMHYTSSPKISSHENMFGETVFIQ